MTTDPADWPAARRPQPHAQGPSDETAPSEANPPGPARGAAPRPDAESGGAAAQRDARGTAPRDEAVTRGGGVTRAGAAWTAVVAGLVLFILLIVFFIQNQDVVAVHFLGLTGPVPLGVALFIAAVAGGVVVAVTGAVRIIQLRSASRRARRGPTPAGR